MGLFFPQIVGIGLLILGFIIFIAGLAASPPEKRQQPMAVTQPMVIPPPVLVI